MNASSYQWRQLQILSSKLTTATLKGCSCSYTPNSQASRSHRSRFSALRSRNATLPTTFPAVRLIPKSVSPCSWNNLPGVRRQRISQLPELRLLFLSLSLSLLTIVMRRRKLPEGERGKHDKLACLKLTKRYVHFRQKQQGNLLVLVTM